MKIKVTVFFKGRRFRAESDDELNNMAEIEAVSDIFSAINYMADDIYAMEPKEKYVQNYAKWTVEYGDIPISSNIEGYDNSIAWSERIRTAVYAIIKVVYRNQDTSQNYPTINPICHLANPPFTPAYNPYELIPSYVSYNGVVGSTPCCNRPLTPIERKVLMSFPEPDEYYNSLVKQITRIKIREELVKLEMEREEKQKRRDNKE